MLEQDDLTDMVARVVAEWRIGQWLAAKGVERPTNVFDVTVAEVLGGPAAAALDQQAIDQFRDYVVDTEVSMGTGWVQESWRLAYQDAVFEWLEARFSLPEYSKSLGPLQAVRLKRGHAAERTWLLDFECTLFPRRRKAKT